MNKKNWAPSQEFVYMRTYARWNDELKRRETWEESVDRYFNFFEDKFGHKVPAKVFKKCYSNVLNMGVMPSMRAFWTAGPALEKNNICGYNCCGLAFKDLQSVAELFYVLMCGAGVGFSVEKEFIDQMPPVAKNDGYNVGTHVVEDSREGWADSIKACLETWFNGHDIQFDYSKVRPAGARLMTIGGRASGPDPLKKLHQSIKEIVLKAQGRKLTSLEWNDIGNLVGEAVVVGGTRRSSEITFSDLEDEEMRHAKDFPFPKYRYMSNNTAVYHKKPDAVTFMKEWSALAASGSGERGIFNLEAAQKSSSRREMCKYLRTNPCGEILGNVNTGFFCNLATVVMRPEDTFVIITEKIKSAVWLAAMQGCLTDFPYIRPSFKTQCKKERLLGVSLGGQMDCLKFLTPSRLQDLKEVALEECKKASKALNINMSVAVTTVKPDGTVSQLCNSSAGAHPRYGKYYIRRYRISATDPLYKMMKDQGVKFYPENGQGPESVEEKRQKLIEYGRSKKEVEMLVPDWTEDSVYTWVCEFPEAAPPKALTRHDVSAIDQLEHYLKLMKNWCEHNASMSVYVKKDEWLKVGSWVYDHFDDIVGVSFFPFEDEEHGYQLAPFESLTKEQYEKMLENFPKIDYSQLSKYELDDYTTGARELACAGGKCSI